MRVDATNNPTIPTYMVTDDNDSHFIVCLRPDFDNGGKVSNAYCSCGCMWNGGGKKCAHMNAVSAATKNNAKITFHYSQFQTIRFAPKPMYRPIVYMCFVCGKPTLRKDLVCSEACLKVLCGRWAAAQARVNVDVERFHRECQEATDRAGAHLAKYSNVR